MLSIHLAAHKRMGRAHLTRTVPRRLPRLGYDSINEHYGRPLGRETTTTPSGGMPLRARGAALAVAQIFLSD